MDLPELVAVIEGDGPRMVFQPIVDMERWQGEPGVPGDAVVGHEALARFEDDTPPSDVFAMAEKIGLGAHLELAAIRAAVKVVPQLPPDTYLSVNASPRTLLLEDVDAALGECPDRIVVEITEQGATDYDGLLASVARLRSLGERMGVRVAADDFGKGESNLVRLLSVGFDIIKLDRDITAGVHRSRIQSDLVTMLVSLSARRKITLCAEGVEEEAERVALLILGVQCGQGFLFGRPLPLGRADA